MIGARNENVIRAICCAANATAELQINRRQTCLAKIRIGHAMCDRKSSGGIESKIDIYGRIICQNIRLNRNFIDESDEATANSSAIRLPIDTCPIPATRYSKRRVS